MALRIEKTRSSATIVFGVAVFLFYSMSRNGWETHAPLLPALLFIAGLFLAGIAALGRMWCSLYIAGYKTRSLITEGPYSMSRNPLYVFSLAGFIGIGLCTGTLLLPALLVAGFALYFPPLIRHEEAKLLKVHGEAYREYLARTPRFFPRFSAFREPAEYVVRPDIFRRHLFDALLFVGAAGVPSLIKALHTLGWLPTLFAIY